MFYFIFFKKTTITLTNKKAQETQKSQNNLVKEQSCKTFSSQFQNLLQSQGGASTRKDI